MIYYLRMMFKELFSSPISILPSPFYNSPFFMASIIFAGARLFINSFFMKSI